VVVVLLVGWCSWPAKLHQQCSIYYDFSLLLLTPPYMHLMIELLAWSYVGRDICPHGL
jgi:hypothetical protein